MIIKYSDIVNETWLPGYVDFNAYHIDNYLIVRLCYCKASGFLGIVMKPGLLRP